MTSSDSYLISSVAPLISVIMPFKNSVSYLHDSINSILNQTEGRFIIYAINNGSVDEGENYVRSIMDKRVITITAGDIGYVRALNLGIQYVNTPYIAICDSDDIYVNTRFENQLKFLQERLDYVLVGANIRYFGTSLLGKKWAIKMPNDNSQIIDSLLKGLSAVVHSTIMLRSDIIKKIGGYDEKYFPAPDYHLFLQLLKYGKLANLNDDLAYVRLHRTSIMTNQLYEGLLKYEEARKGFIQSNRLRFFNNNFSKFINDLVIKFKHLEMRGITLYRKGIFYYVNSNILKGVWFIFCGGIISPRRSIIFIKRILQIGYK